MLVHAETRGVFLGCNEKRIVVVVVVVAIEEEFFVHTRSIAAYTVSIGYYRQLLVVNAIRVLLRTRCILKSK